ncbi:putative zinc protease [Aliiroseovarius sp. xm-m-379]|uniref:M16 family metallopeptidase n=1 Tax=unclassified Aliiroseovarius TaxID=2623558 RepID=UPI001569C182|nr:MULTISPECIES: pitrilysin family protein [unclassified Aliiroseovarius]NRP12564.1 putative zinc protease [Aliiroseovarius sp. xm-d-517]NRP26225.1 putative zinc protease [Aliiroseovarius sp. xm-m-379]NRP31792.1 putative zinc protease [Aliiroseovarius sp. xm-m-314]NRP35024.1 putative zinc protease [Aliiroseovarius sp. xm-a-104]NRP42517.1 putative zinc protease [Aliiroseovarius sp. xm-m-339-2]
MAIEIGRLANGFRVVTENMPGLESASLGIWVMAGGRHETEAQNGIAHFLEHMAFKGTKRRSALEIAEAIEDVGGYLNAYTSREVTAYYARVLKQDVALAFDVISDIVLNPVFDANEIETERGVILQEIGQALDTPDDVVFDWLQEVAFPDQPLGRTILGPVERVQSFTRDDLAGFVAQHYGPEQLILSAAGAVDHDEIMRLAEATFGGLTRGTPPAQVAAGWAAGERHEIRDGLEQVHFTLGLEAPSYRDEAFYAAQLFSSALGGGMSSRLFQEVREKRGLCYSIYAQAGSYDDTGMMTIYAGTSSDDIADLAGLTVQELTRAAQDMSEREMERARTQLKAGLLMGLESPSARVERMARLLGIWDRVPGLEETVAKIDAVTLADIQRVGRKMAFDAPMAMAVYGPAAKALPLSALSERRKAA